MNDTIINIFKDAGIVTTIVAIFFFIFKKWLSKYIDSKFADIADVKKALIEIKKERFSKIYEKKDFIYPEILELVYRLKNDFQKIIEQCNLETTENTNYFSCGELGQELYFLTENLYKYRAYIDDETFNNLHKYKRILQDSKIILNSISRFDADTIGRNPDEMDDLQKKRYLESSTVLMTNLSDVLILYNDITNQIKNHLKIEIKV